MSDASHTTREVDSEGQLTSPLSQRRKFIALAVVSFAIFIDVWCWSAFYVITSSIATDLAIPFTEQALVISSFGVTLASFPPSWGRVADLYSPRPVWSAGFLALGIFSLAVSFATDRFTFLILRALSGVAGACLTPAGYRIIIAIFEPEERNRAFTLFSMAGPLGAVTGGIVAGAFALIPGHDQLAPWRWFFRLLSVIIVPVALISLRVLPRTSTGRKGQWRRLDIVGVSTILAATLLLILGLTLGATHGWATAGFIAPFVLAWPLFAFFFIWERRLADADALLPAKTWRIPNFAVLVVFTLFTNTWWVTSQLTLADWWLMDGATSLIASVRLLPQGAAAGVMTVFLAVYPAITARTRHAVVVGGIMGIVGNILFSLASDPAADFWRLVFPGSIVGSAGNFFAVVAVNNAIMLSVPPEMAGVAGAVFQVALQLGPAVALAVNSALETIHPGELADIRNVQAVFYFQIAWEVVWIVGFVAVYRTVSKGVSATLA